MSISRKAKRRQSLATIALLAVAAPLVSACAPTAYPTVGSYYPLYPTRSDITPFYTPDRFAPQRIPYPSPVEPPTATREPASAAEPPAVPAPQTERGPAPAPAPAPLAGAEPTPQPQATIDSRPPGSRCGWAELCNLWE